MRPGPLLLGLAVLVGCSGRRSAPVATTDRAGPPRDAPAPATTPTAPTPPSPLVPATGRCAEQLAGAGPIACPYPPGPRGGRADLATPFERGGQCESAGLLRLTSGAVVACDPLVFLHSPAFTTRFAPGAYPVVLAQRHGDITHALLRLGEARPVRWAQALLPGEVARPGRVFRYPVDAGTGSYVDDATARTIEQREDAIRTRCGADTTARVDPADADAWHREMAACEARLGPDLYEQLRSAGYHTRRPWANACVDPATGANLIVFSSGAGDGAYPVFIGYAEDGQPVALVTDFGLGDDDE